MATCAANKKVQLAAVLYLALFMAASSRSALATEQQECTVPKEVDACVEQIKQELAKMSVRVPLLTPSCCK
nr:unnamed protein product [Digitaria exilis]